MSTPYEALKSLLDSELAKVDEIIIDAAKSHVNLIPTVTDYLVSSGGKRIRPLLALAAGKLIGCDIEPSVQLAAAVEFIHTATLFHDDVIDESKLRRGKYTANNIWGNKVSILVGDFLLSKAFKLMVATGSLDALEMLSSTSATIIESEVWQLDLINKINMPQDEYIKLITGKTAVLFAAACATPAIVAQIEEHSIKNLYNFGLNLGVAFQITDDLLDYTSQNAKFGKTVGSDLLEGKITLPLIILRSFLANEEYEIYKQSIEKQDIDKVIHLLNKYNCINKCTEIALQYSQLAIQNLSNLRPGKRIHNLLIDLASFLVKRIY